MKFLFPLITAAALLPSVAIARWFNVPRDKPHAAGCEFALSSAEPFACPAGQLEDGQIRLNGSYETASFFIANGGIVDSDGFGCIVTDAPTTQFQCDHGKPPTLGFSIDASNTLLYHGSSSFWACPATDTEYNIYVKPDFGQAKCFPITLKTSGCGAPSTPTYIPSTVWETQTKIVTEDVTQTVTVITTVSPTCPAHWNQTTPTPSGPCKHCTKTKSRAYGLPTHNATAIALSERGYLSKRAVYDDWVHVRDTTRRGLSETDTLKWVRIGEFKFYPISAGLRVATAYFYGCTVFVLVGSKGLFFGHFAEEGAGTGGLCTALAKREDTNRLIIPKIRDSDELLFHPFEDMSPEDCPNERYALIMGSFPDKYREHGPARLKEYFMQTGEDDAKIPPGNLRYIPYGKQTPLDNDPVGPGGKGIVMVDDDGVDAATGQQKLVLRVFLHGEEPRLVLRFRVDNGHMVVDPEIRVAVSADTTDGTKNYH